MKASTSIETLLKKTKTDKIIQSKTDPKRITTIFPSVRIIHSYQVKRPLLWGESNMLISPWRLRTAAPSVEEGGANGLRPSTNEVKSKSFVFSPKPNRSFASIGFGESDKVLPLRDSRFRGGERPESCSKRSSRRTFRLFFFVQLHMSLLRR